MDLKSRALNLWSKDELDIVDVELISDFKFSNTGKKLLSEIGLPRWCAPNMHFAPSDGFNADIRQSINVPIGYDRDERLICLDIQTEIVTALDFDGNRYLIAKHLNELLTFLIVYGEFVETYLTKNVGFSFGSAFPNEEGLSELLSNLDGVCSNLMKSHSWWKMHIDALKNRDPSYFN